MRWWTLLIVVGLSLLLVMPAQGSDRYGYWGFDLLSTELAEDDGAFGAELDDTSAALRIHGGYRANRWLGIEGALQGLGNYHDNGNRFDYSALTLAGMLYLPVSRSFEFYARAGGGVGWVRDQNRRETNNKPIGMVGVGAKAHVSPVLALRGGVDAYAISPRIVDADGNAETRDQGIGVGYVGLSFFF